MLVTQFSKVLFFCVVLLDLLYAGNGIIPVVLALIVVSAGRARDMQAHLIITATVAENLKTPLWVVM